MLTTMEPFDEDALAALIAAATVLGADVQAGLFINDIIVSKTLLVADMEEPAYASYLRQNVVMGDPFRDPINGIAAVSAALLWQQTGTPTPSIIKGIFYTFGAADELMGVEIFPQPIALNDLLDAFSSVLEYIQSSENAGFTTIIR